MLENRWRGKDLRGRNPSRMEKRFPTARREVLVQNTTNLEQALK
jgi:hypothetical protein